MQRIWLCIGRPSTVRWRDFDQAFAGRVSPMRPRKVQRASISAATAARPLRQPDPDADALPVGGEREPGADAEADPPIADQGENQRPAGVMQAAQHAGADHLRAVDQLESRGDPEEADREAR